MDHAFRELFDLPAAQGAKLDLEEWFRPFGSGRRGMPHPAVWEGPV